MLSDFVKTLSTKLDLYGYRLLNVAWKLEEYEDWIEAKNLDFWRLGEARKDLQQQLDYRVKRERELSEEVDKLAAFVWRVTGKWPKGYPASGHYAFYHEYSDEEAKDLPEGGRPDGAIVYAGPNGPSGPSLPKVITTPSKPGYIPINRFGQQIDLTEIDEILAGSEEGKE